MLLHLVKHSMPDIVNAVRELCKALDRTSPVAYKELMRVLKYVLETKYLSLKVKPEISERVQNGILSHTVTVLTHVTVRQE